MRRVALAVTKHLGNYREAKNGESGEEEREREGGGRKVKVTCTGRGGKDGRSETGGGGIIFLFFYSRILI